MYCFVYLKNAIVLYGQEKSTLLMNEYKNVDTPNKNHSVRWCTQDKNMGSVTTKTNNGRNFNMQNSQ